MKLNPYLLFNGQCEAAFNFYAKSLGGKIVAKVTHGESPMTKDTPPERHNKILHASLTVGGNVLMGSDAPPDRYEKPQGFSVTLNLDTPEEAERIFEALSEKGTLHMPPQETFWAVRFGMLVNQFDIPWMIDCQKAAGT
jgi:PhnB protein